METAYEVWKKLEDMYEGNEKVKLTKRLVAKHRFVNLKMEDGEEFTSFFQRVELVANEVRNQVGKLSDEDIIEKILITLPDCYSDKILVIEEMYDPKKYTKEQLFGTLTTFEMRKFQKKEKKT